MSSAILEEAGYVLPNGLNVIALRDGRAGLALSTPEERLSGSSPRYRLDESGWIFRDGSDTSWRAIDLRPSGAPLL